MAWHSSASVPAVSAAIRQQPMVATVQFLKSKSVCPPVLCLIEEGQGAREALRSRGLPCKGSDAKNC
jgi:hypothetical protein